MLQSEFNMASLRHTFASNLVNGIKQADGSLALSVLGDLSKFPDGSKVSAWAQEAMSWATG